MRDDLLKQLRAHKDVTNVLITTFNIDFLFIENVLLRTLRPCGDPSLTIFADMEEIARTFAAQGRWIGKIGRRYRVVPIQMEPGFRFHPKLLLASSTDDATVFVGSGNLTFGGMRQNDELWLRFSTRENPSGVFAAAQRLFEGCANRAKGLDSDGLSSGAALSVREAFNPEHHQWAGGLSEPGDLIWRVGSEPSLLDQVVSLVDPGTIERVTVGCPYFDSNARALRALGDAFPGASVRVVVQPTHCTLTRAAAETLPERYSLVETSGREREGRQAFIHAKFIALERAGRVTVVAGSANCSVAAWLMEGARGNAECMAVIEMSSGAFQSLILDELRPGASPLDALPPSQPDSGDDTESGPAARIVSASLDMGRIRIRYAATDQVEVDELLCDEHAVPEFDHDPARKTVYARVMGRMARVRLRLTCNGQAVETQDHWIDHEYLLSATSRQRKVAAAVEASVSAGKWGFQAWSDILRLMDSHLRYTPSPGTADPGQSATPRPDDGRMLPLSSFYSNGYRVARDDRDLSLLTGSHRIGSLRSVLLENLGVDSGHDLQPDAHEDESVDDDSAEAVDRIENHSGRGESGQSPVKPPSLLTDREVRRGRKLTEQVVDHLINPDFLSHRPPSLLASDFAIGAVLVLAGYAEGWLSTDDYLNLTHEFWTALFFDDAESATAIGQMRGRLQSLVDDSDEPAAMRAALSSPTVAGPLMVWCLSCPPHADQVNRIRFRIAARLAVARLPYLWCLGDSETIKKEAQRVADSSGWLKASGLTWSDLIARWESLVNEAVALCRFEELIARRPLGEWREVVRISDLEKGTVLWQGKKLGFGVLQARVTTGSKGSTSVPVKLLRLQAADAKIQPAFLLPMLGLVEAVRPEIENHIATTLGRLVESVSS